MHKTDPVHLVKSRIAADRGRIPIEKAKAKSLDFHFWQVQKDSEPLLASLGMQAALCKVETAL